MRKLLSVLLCMTILMGHLALLAIPALADPDEDTSSAPENVTEGCVHSFGSWTDDGDTHTQTCSLCGKAVTGRHVFLGETVTTPPTCGTAGSKTVTCHICGAIKEQTIDPIGNHTLTNLVSIGDQSHSGTCSQCGYTGDQAHTWNAGTVIQPATCKDSGSKTVTCTGCQHTKTETIPPNEQHTFSASTPVDNATHTGTCSLCNRVVTQAHTWDAGTVSKPATCLEEGLIVHTCTGCGFVGTKTQEMLSDHSWTRWLPTDDKSHRRICTVCQLEETGEHSYGMEWSHDENIHYHECDACGSQKDIKEHFPGPAATETEPQLCLICQCVLKPALNHEHDFSENWTCNEEGHWHSCSECEEQDDYDEHDYKNDCDADCDDCGYMREVTHEYVEEWVIDREGHYYVCRICGEGQPKLAHISGEDGKTCSICGYLLASDISDTEGGNSGSTAQLQGKKKFPAWGALVIAGVAAALIPVFAFFQREPD